MGLMVHSENLLVRYLSGRKPYQYATSLVKIELPVRYSGSLAGSFPESLPWSLPGNVPRGAGSRSRGRDRLWERSWGRSAGGADRATWASRRPWGVSPPMTKCYKILIKRTPPFGFSVARHGVAKYMMHAIESKGKVANTITLTIRMTACLVTRWNFLKSVPSNHDRHCQMRKTRIPPNEGCRKNMCRAI